MKLENRLLDLVAGVSPWLAPLIPTYFAAYNAFDYLAKGKNWYDGLAVIVVALVVETIGLAGVHTAIQFWNWNRTKNKTDDAAPLGLSILSVIVYVTIIILVNGLLDYYAVADPANLPYVKILAVALLSLLALNSALIVALRAGQSDRESKKQELKAERKAQRAGKLPENGPESAGKLPENGPESSGKLPDDWRKIRPQLSPEQLQFIAHAQSGEIMGVFGVTERTARNWRARAAQELQK